MQQRSILRRATITLLVAAFSFAGLASTAWAEDDAEEPTAYLPGNSLMAAHIDMSKLRKSQHFEEAFNYLRKQQSDQSLSALLKDEAGFDLKEDLDTVAFGLPVSQIKGRKLPDRGTYVFAGNFSKETIQKTLKEKYSELTTTEVEGGLEVLHRDDTDIGFAASNRLVVVKGPESYRKKAWKVVAGKATSFKSAASSGNYLEHLDTDRAVWILNRPTGGGNPAASKLETAALSIDVASGIDIQVVSRSTSDSEAKSMLEQMKSLKKSGANNTMVTMVGAGPLLANLSLQRKKAAIIATTSMTDAELDSLVKSVKQLAKSRGAMQNMPSSSSKGATGSSKKKGDDEESSESDDESSSEDGVDADFN